MGQPTARKICEGLEEAQRGIQQETQGYSTRKKQSPARTEAKKRGGGATTKPYWDPTRPTKKRKMKKPEKQVRKADVFQRVSVGIIRIIRELWFKRNMECHQPLQG